MTDKHPSYLHKAVMDLRMAIALSHLKNKLASRSKKRSIRSLLLEEKDVNEINKHSIEGYQIFSPHDGKVNPWIMQRMINATMRECFEMHKHNLIIYRAEGREELDVQKAFNHVKDQFDEVNTDVAALQIVDKVVYARSSIALVVKTENNDIDNSNNNNSYKVLFIEPWDKDSEVRTIFEHLNLPIIFLRERFTELEIEQMGQELTSWFVVFMYMEYRKQRKELKKYTGADFEKYIGFMKQEQTNFQKLLLLFAKQVYIMLALNMTSRKFVQKHIDEVMTELRKHRELDEGKEFQVFKHNEKNHEHLMTLTETRKKPSQ